MVEINPKTSNLDYDIVDNYFKIKEEISLLEVKLKPLNKDIKSFMEEQNIEEIKIKGYKVKLKTKHIATPEFIQLLKQNNLHHLIDETFPIKLFNKACKELNIGVGARCRYLTPHKSKWLYVEKE